MSHIIAIEPIGLITNNFTGCIIHFQCALSAFYICDDGTFVHSQNPEFHRAGNGKIVKHHATVHGTTNESRHFTGFYIQFLRQLISNQDFIR